MKKEFKIFMFNIAIILLCALTLLTTTLLLDWAFIATKTARQAVIYLLMFIEAFIYLRILLLYNKIRV